ncbi:MAG: hypothetical protein IIA78_01725 [Proteobacteria bacterium]|nr:hypothetical protein [Pseudomonadota bacterium]
MNEKHEDRLMRDAGRLTTRISPERDLWPDIATAIAEQGGSRRTPMLAQAAAVILLVAASSGVTYLAVNSDQPPAEFVPSNLIFEQASFGGRYQLGPDYQDARRHLASRLDRALARLSPDARAGVENNLQVIRDAINDINGALEHEPDNVLLQELLLSTYHQELRVMRNVGGLTHRVMSRNDI